MKLVQSFLLLLLALTTLCLSSVAKNPEAKSKTSRMKSVSSKEEREDELILDEDTWDWLDPYGWTGLDPYGWE